MPNNDNKIEEKIKSLEEKLENMDSMVSQFRPIKEPFKAKVYQVISDKAGDVKDVVSDACGHSKDVLEDTIKDRPFQTAAVCLGIGFLLGALVSRRS